MSTGLSLLTNGSPGLELSRVAPRISQKMPKMTAPQNNTITIIINDIQL